MKLIELNEYMDNLNIYRDAEFDVLGLVVSKTKDKLMTFIEDKKYINEITNNITAVICKENFIKYIPKDIGIIISPNPKITFFNMHNVLSEKLNHYSRKKFHTIIGQNCSISNTAVISNENVIIGDNVIIEEFVVIRENTIINNNSIIRAGSVIGGNGFEYKKYKDTIIPVKHVGGVVIGEFVEIKYNTCIDKAIYPWDNTIIGDYTKIDNLIHIAHAVKIGKRCFLPANTTICGRVEIGDDTWIGVGCSISNGILIGNNARANIGSVVTKDIKDGESVTGNFAIEHKKFIEFIKNIK